MPHLAFWNRSLLARLVSYFLLLSLVTVGIVGYTAYRWATDALQRSVFARLELAATAREDEMALWIDNQTTDVFFIAQSSEVRSFTSDLVRLEESTLQHQLAYNNLSQNLGQVMSRRPDIQELFVLSGSEGVVLVSTDKTSEGISHANTEYFSRGQGGTYIQNVYPLPDGQPTMTIATPILDDVGRRVGVLAANLNLNRMDRIILARTGLGETGETYLVDGQGIFVSAQRFGRQDFADAVRSAGIDAALQQNDGQGLYLNYEGVPVIGVYHWLDDRELALLVEMEQSEALAPANQLAVTIFLVGLASAAVLLIGVYLLARQIARPILALAETASAIATGNLSLTAPVMTNDEVGLLARAFNQMTAQLRLFYGQLEQKVAERTEELTQANSQLVNEISERTRAEEALRESETALRESRTLLYSVIDNAPAGIVVVDIQGRYLVVNRSTAANLGLEPVQMIGKTNADFFPPERVSRFQEYDQMVLTTGQPIRHEETIKANGDMRTYLSTTFPIYDAQGGVSSVGTIYTDITERKRAEEVLQRQNEYLEALHKTTVVMVSRLDITDLLTDIIKRACILVDADQGHIFMLDNETNEMKLEVGIGISDSLIGYRIKPGHGLIGKVWQQGKPIASDHYFLWSKRLQDVSPSLLHPVAGVPLQSGNRVIGVLSMSHWKTRRTFQQSEIDLLGRFAQLAAVAIDNAHLYSEAQAARAAAETANQAKSTFLANMSHELRTPLNAVLGFAQIMERDPVLGSEQREYLGIIRRSGSHLLGLINDVLEVSKIEAGRVTLNEAPFDLHEMLRGVEEMFRLRAESRRLALHFDIDPNTPHYLYGDESKLRQIIINLLGNAVKFTHEGGVTLRVCVDKSNTSASDLSEVGDEQVGGTETDGVLKTEQRSDPATVRLVFDVEDSGVGIAEHELSLLFQAFGQTESGHKAEEGTGLGLVISRQFVKLMGGDITVTSQLGEGTTFTFDVVLALANAADVQTDLQALNVIGLALPDGQEPPRILVVDDRWENRQLLLSWLQPIGFQVREAVNGREAIDIWEAWQPHLIWMDMRMPVLNGYEATKHIKGNTKENATVVIALTASAFEHERTQIMAVGCDDFVHKPVSEATIFAKLGQYLDVEFIYADQPKKQPTPAMRSEHMTRPHEILPIFQATLPLLPNGWRAEFEQAVDELDTAMAQEIIKQLHEHNYELAQSLSHLVTSYRFDLLEELLQATTAAEPTSHQ